MTLAYVASAAPIGAPRPQCGSEETTAATAIGQQKDQPCSGAQNRRA